VSVINLADAVEHVLAQTIGTPSTWLELPPQDDTFEPRAAHPDPHCRVLRRRGSASPRQAVKRTFDR